MRRTKSEMRALCGQLGRALQTRQFDKAAVYQRALNAAKLENAIAEAGEIDIADRKRLVTLLRNGGR